ncbi:MAG: hypothetical protein M3506_00165 [Chloroflexota bacterium]|nr:hypothetical protein [Chloroflexota bacterium]
MIYCERCGFANRQGSLYCNLCGHALVAERLEADEPLPVWLRQATVAGYLWKSEVLLPDWLSQIRPFRELYGEGAVILPPPYNEVVEDPPTPDPPFESAPAGEDYAFFEVEEEEGPLEGDLLLLDDLDIEPEADEPAASTLEFVVASSVDPDLSVDAEVEFERQVTSSGADDPENLFQADEEGESILEVLAGVLRDDAVPEIYVGAAEPFVNDVTQHLEDAASEYDAAELSTQGDAEHVELPLKSLELIPPEPEHGVVAVVDSPESAHGPADGALAEAAIVANANAVAVPETVHPEPELSESGRRFQAAVAFVLEPHPESPPRKARRKGKS